MVNLETIMARRQVEALVKTDPVVVQFERREKIKTDTGGWTWGPVQTLEPQTVTLIPFKRRMTDYLVNTELGEVPDLPYELLGPYNLDIQPDDVFEYQGDKYQVKTLDMEEREVQVRAQVDFYGETTNG